MKRLGILTGGGDVPGLNPCIKTLVYSAVDEGYEVVGIRRGWGGPAELQPRRPLVAARVHHPARQAEHPHASTAPAAPSCTPAAPIPARCAPTDVPDFLHAADADTERQGHVSTLRRTCCSVLEKLGIDVLIPIGGDDTLCYARAPAPRGYSTSSPFPRRWTTTCSAPITASAFPRRSRAAWSSSTSCAPAPARTSASPSSSCSGATAAKRRCWLRTSPAWTAPSSPKSTLIRRSWRALVHGRQEEQSQQLCHGHHERRRADDRRQDRRVRPGRRLRPQEAGRHRPDHGRRAQEDHRRRHPLPAGLLPDALRRARQPRPDGGRELCQHGHAC